MRLGTSSGPPIDCYLCVEDMRALIGVPPFDLVPVSREPLRGIDAPIENMDDVDHM